MNLEEAIRLSALLVSIYVLLKSGFFNGFNILSIIRKKYQITEGNKKTLLKKIKNYLLSLQK